MGQIPRHGADKVQRASFGAQLHIWDGFTSIPQDFMFQKIWKTVAILPRHKPCQATS